MIWIFFSISYINKYINDCLIHNNKMINLNQFIKKQYNKPIRYIIEESFGSTIHDNIASWVEFQVISDDINIALHKPISYNFEPQLDITGQSEVKYINNGICSLEEWVSVNINLQKYKPVKIFIDLQKSYTIDKLIIYHGWWTKRAFKNRIHVSNDAKNWDCIYDYKSDGLFYELENNPFQLILE